MTGTFFDMCAQCGALIPPDSTACPSCQAPVSAAASPEPGVPIAPVAPQASAVELALDVPSGGGVVTAVEEPGNCPACGAFLPLAALECSSCHEQLVGDLVLPGPVLGPAAEAAAFALSALGPPAPSSQALVLEMTADRPVLIPGVRRAFAQGAIPLLSRYQISARFQTAPRPRSGPVAPPTREGGETRRGPWRGLATAALIAGLLGGGVAWSRHVRAKDEPPKHSFAKRAGAASAEAPPAEPPAPALPAPALPATPPGPIPLSRSPGLLFQEELVFGGHTAKWWSSRLGELRGASDEPSRAAFAMTRARAERAGLRVVEAGEALRVEPTEESVKAATARVTR